MRQPIQVLIYPVRLAGGEWEYLLLRRIPSRGGFWQGVTGGIEEGEDLAEAARRELTEETRLAPIALEKIDYSYSFPAEDGEKIIEYVFVAYVGDQQEPIIDLNEHDQYKWCRFDEAFELLTWPENKEALKRCNEVVTTRKVVVTKEDIKKGLRKLGLKRGDIVGVHSSLSSFGYVEGGADSVIDALLEVVGKEGTIAMPTHSSNLEKVELSPEEKAAGVSWLFKILPYDPKETPCTTGIIPETFRKRPGVIRSCHPVFSIAAIGPQAKDITSANDGRSLAGWKVLCELDGYVLLIGVGLGVCTAMHLAESMVKLPKHILEKITPPEWFSGKYGERDK